MRFLKKNYIRNLLVRNLIVSFPKSGRTWLRVMLDEIGVRATYSHCGSEHRFGYHKSDLRLSLQNRYRARVFLHRDPRDTVVSGFHQASHRYSVFNGTISEFIRSPHYGLEKILHFNLLWAEYMARHGRVLVSYEALRANPSFELAQLCSKFGVRIEPEICRNVVEKFEFTKMQAMEANGDFSENYGEILSPTDISNVNTFKVRKGKIGGYVEELTEKDVEWVNEVCDEMKYFEKMNFFSKSQ